MCLNFGQSKETLTIENSLQKIADLRGKSLSSSGTWTPYQVFIHCAQSVEYSMTGYPEMQSEFVQKTVGKASFAFFSSQGRMKHPLGQPIPGAPVLERGEDIEAALNRLTKAYQDFAQYNGFLAPHFTYGALNKDQYIVAHAMHLNNHLEQISVSS